MKMIEVLGLPPQHLLTDAPKVSKYFDRRADGVFVLKQPECQQVTDSVCLFVHGCHCSRHTVYVLVSMTVYSLWSKMSNQDGVVVQNLQENSTTKGILLYTETNQYSTL